MNAGAHVLARVRARGPWWFLVPALLFVLMRGLFTVAEWEAVSPHAAAMIFTGLALWAAWRYRHQTEGGTTSDPGLILMVALLGALLVTLFSHEHRLWGDAVHPYS